MNIERIEAYVWSCSKNQLEEARERAIKRATEIAKNYSDEFLTDVFFNRGDINRANEMFWVWRFPEYLDNIISHLVYTFGFEKEISDDLFAGIDFGYFFGDYFIEAKQIVSEFLNEIDCMYNFNIDSMMLTVKPYRTLKRIERVR